MSPGPTCSATLLGLGSPLLLYYVASFVYHSPQEICRTDCIKGKEYIHSLMFGLHFNPIPSELRLPD